MWITALLTFKTYKPLKLQKGMMFLNTQDNTLIELQEVPLDEYEWYSLYGPPVEPYILDISENPHEISTLALPEQIAWFDKGDESDFLQSITVKQMNNILSRNGGWLDIEMTDDLSMPVLFQEMVTVRYFDPMGQDLIIPEEEQSNE